MLDSDVRDLCNSLRRIASRRFDFAAYDRRRMFAPHVLLELAPLGIFGLHVPKDLGGCGMSFEQMVRVEQQLAAIDVTLAAFVGIHNALGLYPILIHGTAEQKEALHRYARGHALLGLALTEPNAGSDPAAIATVAEACGNGEWRLSGDKLWVGNAGWAQALVVISRLRDANGDKGKFAAFLVPTDRDGVDIGAESATLGLRGIVQNQVRLDGVVVSMRDMLGQPGQGMEVANTAMQLGRLGIGAISIGALKRVLQLALLFTTRRQIAAKPLADRFAVRAALRDCDAEIAFFEAVLTALARRMDAGQPLPEYFAVALKIISTERAWRWADFAVQIAGGRGYDEANQLARLLRDVRILRIFEGPTETLQAYLGTTLLFGFRQLRDAIRTVAGDSDAACTAVRDLEAARSDTLSWLKSANPQMSKRLVEAAGVFLGDFVAWRLSVLIHTLSGAGERPGPVEHLLRQSEANWRAWLRTDYEELARWDGGGLLDKLSQDIGDLRVSRGHEFMAPDDLLQARTTSGPALGA